MSALTPEVLLVSAGCLVGGGWLWWHREAPKTCTCLFLAAGASVGEMLSAALTSPVTLVVLGVVGMLGVFAGGWVWWLHGGRVTDSPLAVSLLAVGALAVCLVVARLTTVGGSGPWVGLVRVLLAVGVVMLAAEVVVKGIWKGRARPRRYHPWLALVVPVLAIAVGVPVLAPLMTGLSGGLATVGAAMTPPTHPSRLVHRNTAGGTR